MLSELYRPKTWTDFAGQPAISDIEAELASPWLFQGTGLRWLFESDGVAGCGKTSAAYVAASALGCSDLSTVRLDSRALQVAELRDIERGLGFFGMSGNGRKCYIIDEIHHLNDSCRKMLLGITESLPTHVALIATTTSVTWADEIDGLFSRWTRFRFSKPNAAALAEHLERIAREQSLAIPAGFRFLAYVQGKIGSRDNESNGNNVRALIDGLPSALRRYQTKAA